ncbi:MAG: TlpA family protein disulfide reductase [Deltaproteobacteria bacterium]|nr:TlpA family protein disulfide reductase [Deltaproteobacteria bacterium]
MIKNVYIILLMFCLLSPRLLSSQSKTSTTVSKEHNELIQQIQLLSDSIPDRPAPDATDEKFDGWRRQDCTIRQKRIEAIEKLELMNLSDEELKPYYVMKLDDIETCIYHIPCEMYEYKNKISSMMDNSTSQGKMLSIELFWKLNLYHINTHLMHISETDLQQIADFELSRKETPEAGRLLASAIKMARPDYAEKVKWSTWITDNMPSESEGYKLITAINRKKTDIGKQFTFKAVDLYGNAITEENFKNKVVLIDYWALWCGFCLQEIPKIKELQEKYHDKGLRIIGVFNDHRIDELKDYLKEKQISWTQLINPNATKDDFMHPLAKQYGISGLPEYLLIDKEGKLVRFAGRVEHLESDIQNLLSKNKDELDHAKF